MWEVGGKLHNCVCYTHRLTFGMNSIFSFTEMISMVQVNGMTNNMEMYTLQVLFTALFSFVKPALEIGSM